MTPIVSIFKLNEKKKHKGYVPTHKIEDADLIIINTCSVRERPVQKLF